MSFFKLSNHLKNLCPLISGSLLKLRAFTEAVGLLSFFVFGVFVSLFVIMHIWCIDGVQTGGESGDIWFAIGISRYKFAAVDVIDMAYRYIFGQSRRRFNHRPIIVELSSPPSNPGIGSDSHVPRLIFPPISPLMYQSLLV
jgi:hypothetical protein